LAELGIPGEATAGAVAGGRAPLAGFAASEARRTAGRPDLLAMDAAMEIVPPVEAADRRQRKTHDFGLYTKKAGQAKSLPSLFLQT
jgi:hypothetical protein